MSVEVEEEVIALPEALEQACARAAEGNLPDAGGVAPKEAWELVQSGQAVLVDVRSGEARKFVGHVPGSQHVAWATGTALTRNPRFARELEAKLAKDGGKEAVVLLLCRSGKSRLHERLQRARRLRRRDRCAAASRRFRRLGLPQAALGAGLSPHPTRHFSGRNHRWPISR